MGFSVTLTTAAASAYGVSGSGTYPVVATRQLADRVDFLIADSGDSQRMKWVPATAEGVTYAAA